MSEPGWASWSLNPEQYEWELTSVIAASPISLLKWNDSDKMSHYYYYYYYVPLWGVFRLQGDILQLWLIIFICYLYHAFFCCSNGFLGNPDPPPPPHTVCTAKWLLCSTMHKLSIISDKTPSQYTSMPHYLSLSVLIIFPNTMFMNTFHLCSSLNTRDQLSHPYIATGLIMLSFDVFIARVTQGMVFLVLPLCSVRCLFWQ